jgi:beta-galactosidase
VAIEGSMNEYNFVKAAVLGLCCLLIFPLSARAAPADIFPPGPAAQGAIHWKDGYFYIDGKPVLIRSGSIHYARVPREMWRDRIWRLKMMGLNCVQTYVFWNASEPKEGQWDLTDNLDLDAWLSLAQEMGMYALVRVGPYACAEWEEGGYPAWLSIKAGMIQREMGPCLPFSDPHMDKIEAIVAKHQVSRGGNVVMMQVENEHSRGWGTDVDDPYLKHLDDQARANGIDIPIFNSGLHHSQDPAGEVPFPSSPSPWYSTEFWTGWINHYGDMNAGMLSEKIRGTWKIIAFGGSGYNYYMAHGGTNFGYSGSGELPGVSYDYSAPVGEAGQLRNFYFYARRAAYFAQTFTPVLAASHDDPSLAKADQSELRITTRTSPNGGSIVFVDHFQRKAGAAPVAAIAPDAAAYHVPRADPNRVIEARLQVGNLTLPHRGKLQVGALEPRTIVVNLPWTDNASFESICTNVLFRQTIGSTDTWVCYGPAGDSGEVTLARKTASGSPSQFDFTYPAGDAVTEIKLDSGDGHQATLLVMNTELTNRTWFVADKLYVGPSFVLEDGGIEFPPEGGKATIYSAAGKSVISQAAAPAPAVPALADWSWRDAAPERSANFSTAGWLSSQGPQPMETYDGFQNWYGWYRTVLHRDKAGPISLHFTGRSGAIAAFMNGRPGTLERLDANAGDNCLAILVKASARPKTTYHGPVGKRNARGVWGGVSTETAATPFAVTWKKWGKPHRDADIAEIAKPGFDDSSWQPLDPVASSQPLKVTRGNSWFRGDFTLSASQTDSILQAPTFGPAKTILYLNGQPVEESEQDVSSILVSGKNTVVVEVQSRLGDSGNLVMSLWHNSPLSHAMWYFQPGLDDLHETAIIGRVTNWDDFLSHEPWQGGESTSAQQPTFWKCSFNYHKPAGWQQSIGLLTTGLKAGHVWLNGHNLGPSPQPYPMYMPECWIRDGQNSLVIFDMEGSKPGEVQLQQYEVHQVAQPQ